MGAQRFRDADLLLSDGATCSCCYALLSRRAAPRCRWWLLRCCAPRPGGKELANSLLVGLQLVVAVMGGTASSPFWEGEVVYVVDWKGCSCFSLCAGAFLALSWSCVLRGSFVFFSLSEGLTAVYRHPNLVSRVGWACLLDARHQASRSRILDHQTWLRRLGCYCDTWGPVCLHAALRQNSMEESNMSRLSFRAYTREAQVLRISKQRIWLRLGVILSLAQRSNK